MTKAYVACATVVVGVLAMANGAFAQSFVDPTGGQAAQVKSDTLGWITSDGAPLVGALLAAGIIIGLLVKFGRKARGAV